MKKNIFNFFIVGISLIILLVLILKTQGLYAFFRQLSMLSFPWVLLSLAFMLLYWSFESLSLHLITLFHGVRKRFRESFSITMVGQFFNSITPFATGGQPAQVIYLMKNGVETGNASSIIMIKFISFQTILTIYSFLVIMFTFQNFKARIPLLLTMTLLGLAVHASMILLTVLFSYNRVLTEKIIKVIFRILKKLRLVKGGEAAEKKLEDSLKKFHDNAAVLKNNPVLMIKTVILTFIQLTFFFSIPYCICRSFGFTSTSFLDLFSASVFVATIISVVPLPGATGGAEGSFYLFFGFFFSGNSIISAILIWRIITYYSCIGFGGLFTVILPKTVKRVIP